MTEPRYGILVIGATKQEAEDYILKRGLPQPAVAESIDGVERRTEGLRVRQVLILESVKHLTDRQLSHLMRLEAFGTVGARTPSNEALRRLRK